MPDLVDHDTETNGNSHQHRGQNLVRMMDEVGAIEILHPEIEDATEWVKQIRRDQEGHRGLNWNQTE